MEIRLPWGLPPWWEPPEVVIEETKERSMHDIHCIAYPDAIRIYNAVLHDIWAVARTEIYSDNEGAVRHAAAPKQVYLVYELLELLYRLVMNSRTARRRKWQAGAMALGSEGPWRRSCCQTTLYAGCWMPGFGSILKSNGRKSGGSLSMAPPALPPRAKRLITIYDDLILVERSALVQMCTAKIRLSHYLTTIDRAEDLSCPCGQAPETIHHVLFVCSWYDDLQRAKWTEGTPQNLREALEQYVRGTAAHATTLGPADGP
ncbi:hypothetical protein Aspvir_009727 [Aspergillus viridinutans]|uniref:Reverse transcriptase n=1 Tax=Aspergillus viridinutans TaxID=75553 RepID=A0A9P3C0K1_ASPVI|nr:uncharacterized protein Aspvir_009727 [Aspergillus viridinutans]GIK05614.1 hypothetical protein Aspvir_009727 [Aspergillus viridinutans]